METSFNQKAKRRYGQNFLIAPEVPRRIAEEGLGNFAGGVLEIGPGRGALTAELAKRGGRVAALEIDKDLIPFLEDKFKEHHNVVIAEGDVLQTDIKAFAAAHFEKAHFPLAVCANIPYYITTPILFKIFACGGIFQTAVVMIQKEVYQKLTAKKGAGDYSRLTVIGDYYARTRKLFDVGAGCFYPKPRVDSVVARLEIYTDPPVKLKMPSLFFEIIDLAFAHRRKTLANCLSSGISLPLTNREAGFLIEKAGFSPNVRGEDLDIFDFSKISDTIFEEKHKAL